MYVCVCIVFIETQKKHALYSDSGQLCAPIALTPDVLEHNSEPQYCSRCRWQNRNPFNLTTKYLVWLIKGAAQLYSVQYFVIYF
jgi:hypothetical protein